MVCFNCGENVIEYDIAAGNGFCTNCGTVVEENTIVNEVTFGETSTGAAMVQGSYVAQGASMSTLSIVSRVLTLLKHVHDWVDLGETEEAESPESKRLLTACPFSARSENLESDFVFYSLAQDPDRCFSNADTRRCRCSCCTDLYARR
jgi:hypothetical protein